ncbi:hypothetical protein [Prauserella marina]|uniref:hypothetical protein n=1 Tax=Prauserella marina TaxID=530584 RepID=UPI00115FD75B|nr:hypothetical protein [Prauserella marina]
MSEYPSAQWSGQPANQQVPPQPQQQPPKRSRGLVAGIAAGALVVGAGLGVLLGYLFFDNAPSSENAADANLTMGCDIVERLATSHPGEDDWPSLDEPALWEVMGAGPLLVAAAKSDERHAEFEDLGNDLTSSVTRMDVQQLTETVQTVSARCEAVS